MSRPAGIVKEDEMTEAERLLLQWNSHGPDAVFLAELRDYGREAAEKALHSAAERVRALPGLYVPNYPEVDALIARAEVLAILQAASE
jgi:hypothetical protein